MSQTSGISTFASCRRDSSSGKYREFKAKLQKAPVVFLFQKRMRLLRLLPILLLTLVGCSPSAELSRSSYETYLPSRHSEIKDISSCLDLFSKTQEDGVDAIDTNAIEMLSWNIKKGEKDSWQDDMEHLASGKQLVLMQEALDTMQDRDFFRDNGHWTFAEGYTSSYGKTGVANFSSIRPIGQCELQAYEPWLGSPKASMITRYAINERKETLVVVNSHLINFTLGTTDYEQQLRDIVSAIANHAGPLIISGDFNTWNERRLAHLYAAMAALDVTPVSYEVDKRSRFFGLPVDHIFVRGFSVLEAKTHSLESSDHNPITLSLNLLSTKK